MYGFSCSFSIEIEKWFKMLKKSLKNLPIQQNRLSEPQCVGVCVFLKVRFVLIDAYRV